MNKLLTLILTLVLALSLAACGGNTNNDNSNSTNGSDVGDKAYLDLINKIEVGDSLDKINEIIGSEGKVQSDNATYIWDIGSGGFSAIFRQNDTSASISVKVLYDNEDVVNSKVKIKDLDTLKAKVRDGISYDDFKEFLGGVDGILVEKGPVTKGYVWRSSNGSDVTAGFKLDNNICNSFAGTEK